MQTGGKPVGLVKGEPPSIFGDGSNIVIHRDDGSDGGGGVSNNGYDKPIIVKQQTSTTAGESTASPDITGHGDIAAAETVGENHGADDAVMTDALAQQLDNENPPVAGDGHDRDENSSLTARVMMLAETV